MCHENSHTDGQIFNTTSMSSMDLNLIWNKISTKCFPLKMLSNVSKQSHVCVKVSYELKTKGMLFQFLLNISDLKSNLFSCRSPIQIFFNLKIWLSTESRTLQNFHFPFSLSFKSQKFPKNSKKYFFIFTNKI